MVGRLIAEESGPSLGPDAPAASGVPCVVKLIARRCGADAHRQAHNAGAAPALLRVAVLPGGWRVVAVERLDAENGWHALDRSQPGQLEAVRAAWRRGIAAHGSVHGNLRNANIIVHGARGLAPLLAVRFIDFDWAGRAGEVCYPLTRNAELDWAPGSAP